MMSESCETCRFFKAREEDELDHDDGDGKCRRYPPVLITGLDDEEHILITGIAGNETDFFSQPYVRGYGWCGEWMARLKRKKKCSLMMKSS
jgi:hypothetical protein